MSNVYSSIVAKQAGLISQKLEANMSGAQKFKFERFDNKKFSETNYFQAKNSIGKHIANNGDLDSVERLADSVFHVVAEGYDDSKVINGMKIDELKVDSRNLVTHNLLLKAQQYKSAYNENTLLQKGLAARGKDFHESVELSNSKMPHFNPLPAKNGQQLTFAEAYGTADLNNASPSGFALEQADVQMIPTILVAMHTQAMFTREVQAGVTMKRYDVPFTSIQSFDKDGVIRVNYEMINALRSKNLYTDGLLGSLSADFNTALPNVYDERSIAVGIVGTRAAITAFEANKTTKVNVYNLLTDMQQKDYHIDRDASIDYIIVSIAKRVNSSLTNITDTDWYLHQRIYLNSTVVISNATHELQLEARVQKIPYFFEGDNTQYEANGKIVVTVVTGGETQFQGKGGDMTITTNIHKHIDPATGTETDCVPIIVEAVGIRLQYLPVMNTYKESSMVAMEGSRFAITSSWNGTPLKLAHSPWINSETTAAAESGIQNTDQIYAQLLEQGTRLMIDLLQHKQEAYVRRDGDKMSADFIDTDPNRGTGIAGSVSSQFRTYIPTGMTAAEMSIRSAPLFHKLGGWAAQFNYDPTEGVIGQNPQDIAQRQFFAILDSTTAQIVKSTHISQNSEMDIVLYGSFECAQYIANVYWNHISQEGDKEENSTKTNFVGDLIGRNSRGYFTNGHGKTIYVIGVNDKRISNAQNSFMEVVPVSRNKSTPFKVFIFSQVLSYDGIDPVGGKTFATFVWVKDGLFTLTYLHGRVAFLNVYNERGEFDPERAQSLQNHKSRQVYNRALAAPTDENGVPIDTTVNADGSQTPTLPSPVGADGTARHNFVNTGSAFEGVMSDGGTVTPIDETVTSDLGNGFRFRAANNVFSKAGTFTLQVTPNIDATNITLGSATTTGITATFTNSTVVLSAAASVAVGEKTITLELVNGDSAETIDVTFDVVITA